MSTKEELEEFEYQLETVNASLQEDASNAELLTLKEELENLISLAKEYLGQQPSTSTSTSSQNAAASSSKNSSQHWHHSSLSSSSSSSAFTAGMEVLAKWKVDNRMYPARIASVSGSKEDPVYTVIFNIDKSTEIVRKGDIKALSENRKRAFERMEDSTNGSKEASPALADKDAKKVKKVEKKAVKEEERKARVAEQNNKQSSWQSFAKKGAKKGIKIAGFTGESQFKSPDNPYGRVGVVGSGKGMTEFEQKKRAKWEE